MENPTKNKLLTIKQDFDLEDKHKGSSSLIIDQAQIISSTSLNNSYRSDNTTTIDTESQSQSISSSNLSTSLMPSISSISLTSNLPDSNTYNLMKSTILSNITDITKLNFFMHHLITDLNNLFNKIDCSIFKKVKSILDKHKYFLRFFKEISALYETFSISLLQSNNTITLHFKDEDGPFTQINNTIEKSQELISNSFYDFSKHLQNKIIVKGPLFCIPELYNKMNQINKETTSLIAELIKKRDKLIVNFSRNEKLFENFKKCYNDYEKVNNLLIKNEFFLVEFVFLNSVNKLFKKVHQFLNNHKKCLQELKALNSQFITAVGESIDIYLQESKRMFLIEEMYNNNMDMLKTQFNSLDESIDILFSTDTSLSNQIINEHLLTFQSNIQKFPFITNEQIHINENFVFQRYKSYEDFNDFLISLIPIKLETKFNSNLIIFSCELKKFYGLFNNSKTCVLVITIQNSVLLFEDRINKKTYEKFSLKNLKFKNLLDKNNPYKFEISELKFGMIYNSTLKIILDAEKEETYKLIEAHLNCK